MGCKTHGPIYLEAVLERDYEPCYGRECLCILTSINVASPNLKHFSPNKLSYSILCRYGMWVMV